jgi:hypothetical protein
VSEIQKSNNPKRNGHLPIFAGMVAAALVAQGDHQSSSTHAARADDFSGLVVPERPLMPAQASSSPSADQAIGERTASQLIPPQTKASSPVSPPLKTDNLAVSSRHVDQLSKDDVDRIAAAVAEKLSSQITTTTNQSMSRAAMIGWIMSVTGLLAAAYAFSRARTKSDLDTKDKKRDLDIILPPSRQFLIEDPKMIEVTEKPSNTNGRPFYQFSDQRLKIDISEVYGPYLKRLLEIASKECSPTDIFVLEKLDGLKPPSRWVRDMLVGFEFGHAFRALTSRIEGSGDMLKELEACIEGEFGDRVVGGAVEGKRRGLTYVLFDVVCDVEVDGNGKQVKQVIKHPVFPAGQLEKFGDQDYVRYLIEDNPTKKREIELAVVCYEAEMRARAETARLGKPQNPYHPLHDRFKEPIGGKLTVVAITHRPPDKVNGRAGVLDTDVHPIK